MKRRGELVSVDSVRHSVSEHELSAEKNYLKLDHMGRARIAVDSETTQAITTTNRAEGGTVRAALVASEVLRRAAPDLGVIRNLDPTHQSMMVDLSAG
jgi:hypothetical protein